MYDTPSEDGSPTDARRWGAVAWILPSVVLVAMFGYVVAGILVQKYWP